GRPLGRHEALSRARGDVCIGMDAGSASVDGGHGPRSGGERRAPRAAHSDDPVDGVSSPLSAVVWRRFNIWDGRAIGPHGLADRPGWNAWSRRTRRLGGGGKHLDHAWTVLGLSARWPLPLESASHSFASASSFTTWRNRPRISRLDAANS